MYEYRITLNTYEDTAREMLKGMTLKLFLVQQRAFIKIITAALKSKADRVEKEKDKIIFIEVSDNLEYLKRQKAMLDKFLGGDESTLGNKGSEQYKRMVNDRFVQKVVKGAHKLSGKIKDKAISKALLGSDIFSFFAKIGIFIDLSILTVQGKKVE